MEHEETTRANRGAWHAARRGYRCDENMARDGSTAALLHLLEIAVLEAEIRLLALTPRVFPVKVDVLQRRGRTSRPAEWSADARNRAGFAGRKTHHALLVVVGDGLRLAQPLEPRQILLMEAPALLLELPGGEPPARADGAQMNGVSEKSASRTRREGKVSVTHCSYEFAW
jgi:hypothetical protein